MGIVAAGLSSNTWREMWLDVMGSNLFVASSRQTVLMFASFFTVTITVSTPWSSNKVLPQLWIRDNEPVWRSICLKVFAESMPNHAFGVIKQSVPFDFSTS
jgi:hypothetical protein